MGGIDQERKKHKEKMFEKQHKTYKWTSVKRAMTSWSPWCMPIYKKMTKKYLKENDD
jgi:hypothetical protein